MPYAKIDSVLYKCIWNYPGGSLDITKYIITHGSEDGITIENNKMNLTLKLIRDVPYERVPGVFLPFFANSATGKQMLSTESFFTIYTKYDDGSDIDVTSNDDKLKTYFLTDWNVDEPSDKISISAVDLQYKIINRNTNNVYSEVHNGTSTTIAGAVLTDSGASFKLPNGTARYEDGLLYQTLEVTQGAATNTYLITSNDATTVTVHKTITETTGATYRIGASSAYAVFNVIEDVARSRQGQGQDFLEITAVATLDYANDYTSGIQMLRPDNSAFPIVDIGEPYMPVYKMIKELSGFSACNTEIELANPPDMIINRDMLFAINWDPDTSKTVVNWFYLYKAQKLATEHEVTAVTTSQVTVNGTGSAGDEGGIARIEYTRTINGNSITKFRNYNILAVSGDDYTLSSDPTIDGIESGDDFFVWKGADFIWDSEQDFKHIYNLKLGGQDEETYNQVLFDAGRNVVAGRSILGHWFNEETKSDTLLSTFIPMTHIAKRMIKHVSTGIDGSQKVIKKVEDEWQGWDGAVFTAVANDWDFTTTFGTVDTYVITSRTSFNVSLKQAARKAAKNLSRELATRVNANILKGTFQTRGQRFITTGSGSDSIGKWYQKGTRILFKRPEDGLVNDGGTYYQLVVTKIRQQIDSTRWIVSMDVEYSRYLQEELNK